MKITTSFFKSAVLVFLIALLTWQCQSGPSRSDLEEKNDSLAQTIAIKDTQMNQMVNTIGDIEATLRVIKEKEKIIALKAEKGDARGNAADEINNDIRYIYDLMVQNKERIESLEQQLKRSGIETDRLKRLVDNLNQELTEKNQEIMALNNLLKNKNTEIDDMTYKLTDMEITLDSIKQVSEEVQYELQATKEDMYTAYYAIGTKKELKDKNIINKDGFLFFGKTELLKDDFDEEYFVTIDTRKTDSLELFQSKIQILTPHPEDSYTLSQTESGNQTLIINDKEGFWDISKYLVIQAK
jgi:chromosome segregation ATPase